MTKTDEALKLLAPIEAAIEAIPLPAADHGKVLGAFFSLRSAIAAFGGDEVAVGPAVINVDGLPTQTTVEENP